MNNRIKKKIRNRQFIIVDCAVDPHVLCAENYHDKRDIIRNIHVRNTSIAHRRFKDKGYNQQLRMARIFGKLRKVSNYE